MKFKIKRSGKEFYYIIIGANNKTMTTSETFKRKATLLKSIESIKKSAAKAQTVDEA